MNQTTAPAPALCATGIPGLDDILMGGLPRHRLYLMEGEPGVGKTTLGLQFLLEGLRLKEKCMYITLSETRAELNEVTRSHGWDVEELSICDLSSVEGFLEGDEQSTVFHGSEVELGQITKILLAEIGKVKPDRLVFDSLSELRLLSQSPLRFRRQLLSLKQHFSTAECTVVLMDNGNHKSHDQEIQSLAHGVISLEQMAPVYGPERRRLRVVKLRGCTFHGGYNDYRIATGGLVVYPRLVMAKKPLQHQGGSLSSGMEALDALTGGGLDSGTSTLFMGPPGTGKSTLSACYATAAAARGENSLICTFDEQVELYIQRADSIGLRLSHWIETGLVAARQINPDAQSPGEFAQTIRQEVEARDIRLVVIDSLNGYPNAMPEKRLLAVQLHELITWLSDRGVATILIWTHQGVIGTMQGPIDITYLADTVLVLRYFEMQGAVRHAISAIKKRSGNHEHSLREYRMDSCGFHVGQPLADFEGLLTGTPKFTGEASAMIQTPPQDA